MCETLEMCQFFLREDVSIDIPFDQTHEGATNTNSLTAKS